MPLTKINVDAVISSGSDASEASKNILSAGQTVNNVQLQLDNAIKARRNINARLSSLASSLKSISSCTTSLKAFADAGANLYRLTDERITIKAAGIK